MTAEGMACQGRLWESKDPFQVSEEDGLVPNLGLEVEGCLSRQPRTVKLQGFPRQVPAWFPGWDTLQSCNATVATGWIPRPGGRGWDGTGRRAGGGARGHLRRSRRVLAALEPSRRDRLDWHPRLPRPAMVVHQ
jgi:hypothetical protein